MNKLFPPIVVTLMLILGGQTVFSQLLSRDVFLGIAVNNGGQYVEDGLTLSAVIPGSTAAGLGMQGGNVLQKFNGHVLHNMSDVRQALKGLKPGDKVTATFVADGKTVSKTGKALEKPRETSTYGKVTYDQVDYPGNRLRCIMHYPKDVKNAPVVYFIQGFGCGSTELVGHDKSPTRKLIDRWMKAGYAVFRIEKPGVGDSKSEVGCADIDFVQEVEAFRQGYQKLLSYDDIDPDQVFLFGHSLGGLVAPLLAETKQPAGIMVYGTVAVSWYEYLLNLNRIQPVLFGTSDQTIEDEARIAIPILYDLLVAGKTPEEIMKNPMHKEFLTGSRNYLSYRDDHFLGRHYTLQKTINDVDITKAWRSVDCRVLAIYGEFDIEALNSDGAIRIAEIVNHAHPGNGTSLIIPKATHGMVEVNSMEEHIKLLNSGQMGSYSQSHFKEAVAAESIQWMQK